MELYDIPDFYGYQIDKNGNVYTRLAQGCRNRYDRTKWTEPVLLNYRYTKTGYARVYMRRESTGKREDVYVHRLVAEMFIPNERNVNCVNHIDANKNNNSVENLEWCTQGENVDWAITLGHMKRNKTTGRYESMMV